MVCVGGGWRGRLTFNTQRKRILLPPAPVGFVTRVFNTDQSGVRFVRKPEKFKYQIKILVQSVPTGIRSGSIGNRSF
jgi:hypothetical protein